jgi:cyclopropane fatty-acyl-phospholipid synthase-like methyltransferase
VDDPARIVAAGYDAVADRYAALEGDAEWPRTRWVADLAGRLPAGAAVLELGCGNGVPVARDLARLGFEVTGVDISPEQVGRAGNAVPEATFVVGDMVDVELPESRFAAALAIYAIDHVPRERHADVYRRIRRWLRPGGLLLVAIEDSDQPGVVSEWLGAPNFFSTHEAGVERGLVERSGFEVLSAAVEAQWEHGHDVPYLWLLARGDAVPED